MANYQSPANPYDINNLAPRDAGLAFSREFGLNVNPDNGESFIATDTGEVADAVITNDARLGMLQCDTTAGPYVEQPRGTTILLPPWSTYAESPIFEGADAKFIMIYAHLILQAPPLSAEDDDANSADLILAPEDFVGQSGTREFASVSIRATEANPDDVQTLNYFDGGDTDPDAEEIPGWGPDVYIRIVAAGSDVKETDMIVSVSHGTGWQTIADLQLDAPLRRIGLGCRGNAVGLLDWVRVYNWQVVSANETENQLLPLAPLTGARIFTGI